MGGFIAIYTIVCHVSFWHGLKKMGCSLQANSSFGRQPLLQVTPTQQRKRRIDKVENMYQDLTCDYGSVLCVFLAQLGLCMFYVFEMNGDEADPPGTKGDDRTTEANPGDNIGLKIKN